MSQRESLIETLRTKGVLKNPLVRKAFSSIDRKDFVQPEYQSEAYEDHPLPIGSAQTISQPYTVAFMLDLLSPEEGQRILDVGSGSGWTTALLASIVGPKGKVFGVEIIPELVEFGKKNLATYSFPHASIQEASESYGLKEEAPFDRILVSAAGKQVPVELRAQLKVGGVLVMPVQNALVRIERTSEEMFAEEKIEGFVFVPLTQKIRK